MPTISSGSGGTPSGAAGGDLGGTYPNPTVTGATHITAASIALSKLADPTTGKVVGSSSNAAAAVFPPGYEIGYDQITGNVAVASTTEATGTTIISAASHTFDGGLVMVEFFAYFAVTGTTAASDVIVSLFESTTQIARLAAIQTSGVSIMGAPLNGRLRFTPTAAAHTYTVTAFTTNVTGTPQINAGSLAPAPPAFIRFTKV